MGDNAQEAVKKSQKKKKKKKNAKSKKPTDKIASQWTYSISFLGVSVVAALAYAMFHSRHEIHPTDGAKVFKKIKGTIFCCLWFVLGAEKTKMRPSFFFCCGQKNVLFFLYDVKFWGNVFYFFFCNECFLYVE